MHLNLTKTPQQLPRPRSSSSSSSSSSSATPFPTTTCRSRLTSFPPSKSTDQIPPLQSVPYFTAAVGYAADPNTRFRPTMEDSAVAVCYDDFPGLFVAVYDGHGGPTAANLVAQQLHRHFLDALLPDHHHDPVATAYDPSLCDDQSNSECSTPPYDIVEHVPDHPLNTSHLDDAAAFRTAYDKMDAVLRTRRCVRTGCTAVTCFVRQVQPVGRILTVANCGDSRAVLCRGGRPWRLSEDHRPVEAVERARVEAAGGFVTAGRVNGVLNVSRAFGDHSMKSVVTSTPFVRRVVLEALDDFVVLACDGLWDFVDERTVVAMARDGFDRGFNAREVAKLLVAEAIKKKSTDNVTVVVVQFDIDE